MAKDWQARFEASERRPVPRWIWFVLLAFAPIPFGPWWVAVPAFILAAARIFLIKRRRLKQR